jgi:hypothetical protein
MSAKLDMTAMYGAHDALRRGLELPPGPRPGSMTTPFADSGRRRQMGAVQAVLHVYLTKPLAMYAQTALVRRYGRPNDLDDHELLRTLVLDGLLR